MQGGLRQRAPLRSACLRIWRSGIFWREGIPAPDDRVQLCIRQQRWEAATEPLADSGTDKTVPELLLTSSDCMYAQVLQYRSDRVSVVRYVDCSASDVHPPPTRLCGDLLDAVQ